VTRKDETNDHRPIISAEAPLLRHPSEQFLSRRLRADNPAHVFSPSCHPSILLRDETSALTAPFTALPERTRDGGDEAIFVTCASLHKLRLSDTHSAGSSFRS
jgi:hypothetical protein